MVECQSTFMEPETLSIYRSLTHSGVSTNFQALQIEENMSFYAKNVCSMPHNSANHFLHFKFLYGAMGRGCPVSKAPWTHAN